MIVPTLETRVEETASGRTSVGRILAERGSTEVPFPPEDVEDLCLGSHVGEGAAVQGPEG